MKKIAFAAALMAASATALAADVGISIAVGEPGFYGRLNIGSAPPPVIYENPMIVGRVAVGRPPIYLRVPPGELKHWRRHCHKYHACDERVYFVQDNWYLNDYAPRYRAEHRMERREDRREHRQDIREDRREHREDIREDRRERREDRWERRHGY